MTTATKTRPAQSELERLEEELAGLVAELAATRSAIDAAGAARLALDERHRREMEPLRGRILGDDPANSAQGLRVTGLLAEHDEELEKLTGVAVGLNRERVSLTRRIEELRERIRAARRVNRYPAVSTADLGAFAEAVVATTTVHDAAVRALADVPRRLAEANETGDARTLIAARREAEELRVAAGMANRARLRAVLAHVRALAATAAAAAEATTARLEELALVLAAAQAEHDEAADVSRRAWALLTDRQRAERRAVDELDAHESSGRAEDAA
jgi:hypothetical protein